MLLGASGGDIRAVAEACDHRWRLVVGGLLLLAGGGEDRLEDCPRRGEISARGVLWGVPQTEDQGLRPLFPHKEGLDSLRRWLWTFAWLHNLIMNGYF